MNLKTLLDTPPWDWPRNAGRILHGVLVDRTASETDRAIAAELAGNLSVINDRIAESLMRIAGQTDEPEAVRAAAAIALGPSLEDADTMGFDEMGDTPITEKTYKAARKILRKVYADESVPKEVRRRALEAAVRSPEAWQEKAVAAAYGCGDAEWRLTAVFCMRWVRGFDREILEALRSSDRDLQSEALQAAGAFQVEGAWEHIEQILAAEETPKTVLLYAIEAAGNMGGEEAIEALEAFADSEDDAIAEAVEEALSMAGSSGWDTDFEDEEDPDEQGKGIGGGWVN